MIYRIIALIILLLFYGCHFVKMINQKRRGIRTNQMGRGKEGIAKAIELILGISTIIAPITEIFSIFIGTAPLFVPVRILGAVIGVIGVTIFIIAVVQMRDSWRAGVPENDKTELVTGGIFSISRNPAFLGFDLVYIGILMMFFNYVLLVATIFASVMIHFQIVNVEEEFLQKAFGEEYLLYKKRVNRYVGTKRTGKDKIELRTFCDKNNSTKMEGNEHD